MGFLARLRNVFSFGTDVFDPSHRFETSWLLTPWVLFGFRALIVRPLAPPQLSNNHTKNHPRPSTRLSPSSSTQLTQPSTLSVVAPPPRLSPSPTSPSSPTGAYFSTSSSRQFTPSRTRGPGRPSSPNSHAHCKRCIPSTTLPSCATRFW
jgi:hypothetical protein